MKNFLLSVTACLIFYGASNAQRPITVQDTNITFKHGTYPGFMVTIPEVEYKTIEGSWIKLKEKGTKSKVQNVEGEFEIFGALIKDIATAPINIYSYIKDQDTEILLAVSFELQKNDFITMEKRSEEFARTKDFLLSFAKEHYLKLAEEQLQTEEKKLSKIESDLKSLENNKTKLEKMIQSNTTAIGSANDELVILRTNLLSLNDELLAQTNQFNAMEEGTAKEEKKKYIGDLEKNIKKTNKSIESDEKKIVDMKAEIEKAQNDELPNNLKEQEQIKTAINQQKEVVRSYTDKYNTIKDFK
ncbi:MAG: hypothetical protein JW973_16470 [Bacteroidales bacterium]|nr:hypothetical protein [Bacteroidales bacterium]